MAARKKSERSALATSAGDSVQWPRKHTLGGVLIIAGLVFFAYSRALNGGFVWDDEPLISKNKLVVAPDGLQRIWFTREPVDYWPVTNSAFWLEWRCFDNSPTGYHVTNVVFHILNSLLVWAIVRRLNIPGAFLAALLFAVHPVNVESVMWIAQLKNTLSMFFMLCSALAYLKIEVPEPVPDRMYAAGAGRWYWLSLMLFTLAMLSKGSVVVLPALLLLIIWWRRGISRWDMVRMSPYFVIGAALTLVNIWFQKHGANVTVRDANGLERLLGAGGVVWFYLWKAIVPIQLNFVYPQWTVRANEARWWISILTACAVTAILWWQRQTTWGKALLFAWGFFCVALVPVMGFVDVIFMQYSLVADHYQYVALVGVVVLAAAAWSLWRKKSQAVVQRALIGLAAVVVGIFTALSFVQAGSYRDSVTLYQSILAKNPECWMAYNNLGIEMDSQNRLTEAIENYQKGLALNPADTEAENNLGSALLRSGKVQEAIPHFKRAIELNSRFAPAYYNLGNALAEMGQKAEAIKQYEIARDYAEDNATAHNNLAQGFCSVGMMEEGIAEFKRALALDPQLFDAENNLGGALVQIGRSAEAIPHFERALKINPNFGSAHNNYAIALMNTRHPNEAIAQFQEATRVQPDYLDAYTNLAIALAQMNRSTEAIAAAQRGLSIARQQGNTAKAQQIEAWLKRQGSSH